jgi:hypothetical protein
MWEGRGMVGVLFNSTNVINMNINKLFSGYQLCQLVKITDVSGTISVPTIRAMNNSSSLFWWQVNFVKKHVISSCAFFFTIPCFSRVVHTSSVALVLIEVVLLALTEFLCWLLQCWKPECLYAIKSRHLWGQWISIYVHYDPDTFMVFISHYNSRVLGYYAEMDRHRFRP